MLDPRAGAPTQRHLQLLPSCPPLGAAASSEGLHLLRPSPAAPGAPLEAATLATLDGLVLIRGSKCHACIVDYPRVKFYLLFSQYLKKYDLLAFDAIAVEKAVASPIAVPLWAIHTVF